MKKFFGDVPEYSFTSRYKLFVVNANFSAIVLMDGCSVSCVSTINLNSTNFDKLVFKIVTGSFLKYALFNSDNSKFK
jgi:hypothetical protein